MKTYLDNKPHFQYTQLQKFKKEYLCSGFKCVRYKLDLYCGKPVERLTVPILFTAHSQMEAARQIRGRNWKKNNYPSRTLCNNQTLQYTLIFITPVEVPWFQSVNAYCV